MFTTLTDRNNWSAIGLRVIVGGFLSSVALSLLDGIIRGPLLMSFHSSHGSLEMFATWCYNLRIVTDELMFVGAIIFVGGKFFETRTIFTIGFDKLEAASVTMKGPDDDNVVWIGHRYANRLEAEAVASSIAERLKASA